MTRPARFLSGSVRLAVGVVVLAAGANAQPAASGGPVSLSVEEAVEIALVRNYALRRALLEAESADARADGARAAFLPSVTSQSSYTRNVATPSPFAGTSADDVFAGMGATDFLLFNERARTDDDPATVPISFQEFQRRQAAGIREAGGNPGGGGPSFNVPNQVRAGVSVEQAIYDPVAFASLEAARTLGDASEAGALRQARAVADSVRRAYYRVLLAEARAGIQEQAVARARENADDAAALVEQGLASVYRRSSAQVELVNNRTDFLESQNNAAVAVDALKLAIGLPPSLPLRLTTELSAGPFALDDVTIDRAVESAIDRRADLRRARLTVEARQSQAQATRYRLYPRLSAFADLAYVGNIPDDRTRVVQSETSPFEYQEQTRDFFSNAYWSPAVSGGFRLRWSLFDGGAVRAQLRQDQVEVEIAQVRLAELRDAVAFQVERAVRDLESARERLAAQAENVDLAEQNYSFVRRRVQVGLATDLERREASDQLDRARLGFANATFDFLDARSRFEAAVGTPVVAPPVERVIIDITTGD